MSVTRLDTLPHGQRAIITDIDESDPAIAERLRELGFAEDLSIEITASGTIGGDPIVVMIEGMRVALRRAYAQRIGVSPDV